MTTHGGQKKSVAPMTIKWRENKQFDSFSFEMYWIFINQTCKTVQNQNPVHFKPAESCVYLIHHQPSSAPTPPPEVHHVVKAAGISHGISKLLTLPKRETNIDERHPPPQQSNHRHFPSPPALLIPNNNSRSSHVRLPPSPRPLPPNHRQLVPRTRHPLARPSLLPPNQTNTPSCSITISRYSRL